MRFFLLRYPLLHVDFDESFCIFGCMLPLSRIVEIASRVFGNGGLICARLGSNLQRGFLLASQVHSSWRRWLVVVIASRTRAIVGLLAARARVAGFKSLASQGQRLKSVKFHLEALSLAVFQDIFHWTLLSE